MCEQSSQPLLSVIVPVYKVERYLDQCVSSILGQTLTDIEVILVDDGSPDACPAMCDAYAAADPRVRAVHKANEGLGNARNTGLLHATGRYVAFVDSDDFLEPSTYEEAIRQLVDHDADTVRFACNRFTDRGEASPVSYDAPPVIFSSPADLRQLALCVFDIPSPALDRFDLGGSSCMAIYKMQIIRQHSLRFENEREYLSEDYIFNFDYYRHSSRVVWLNRTYYHYRITPQSLTRKLNLNVMARVETYCRYLCRMMTSRGFGPDDLRYATGFYIRALRANMRFVFLSRDLTLAQKKQWFARCTADPYFREKAALYPAASLPLKQRILLSTMLAQRFCLSYALIVGFSLLRKDKLK